MWHLSTPAKVLLGLATAWSIVWPFLYFVGWFVVVFGFVLVSPPGRSAPSAIGPPFASGILLVMCLFLFSTLLGVAVQIVYFVHVITNRVGADNWRVMLGIG